MNCRFEGKVLLHRPTTMIPPIHYYSRTNFSSTCVSIFKLLFRFAQDPRRKYTSFGSMSLMPSSLKVHFVEYSNHHTKVVKRRSIVQRNRISILPWLVFSRIIPPTISTNPAVAGSVSGIACADTPQTASEGWKTA